MRIDVTAELPISMEEARALGSAILDAGIASVVVVRDVALRGNPRETTIVQASKPEAVNEVPIRLNTHTDPVVSSDKFVASMALEVMATLCAAYQDAIEKPSHWPDYMHHLINARHHLDQAASFINMMPKDSDPPCPTAGEIRRTMPYLGISSR